MTIRAVVLDIGGVLEIIDESIFPGPWPERLGLTSDELGDRLLPLARSGAIGGITEQGMDDEWRRLLNVDETTLAIMREDMWRWYLGSPASIAAMEQILTTA